jgi:hypothetical protein
MVDPSSRRLVSFEDLKWFSDCSVISAGPAEDWNTWVQLTSLDGEFTEEWFMALPTISQQVLDTALVALQASLVCTVAVTRIGGRDLPNPA